LRHLLLGKQNALLHDRTSRLADRLRSEQAFPIRTRRSRLRCRFRLDSRLPVITGFSFRSRGVGAFRQGSLTRTSSRDAFALPRFAETDFTCW
jgi:hypothetical protein